MVILCYVVTISFPILSSPIIKFLDVIYLQMTNDAYNVVSPRLEVTADHRVVNVTPEGAQQQVTERCPKKLCFNSIENQNLTVND